MGILAEDIFDSIDWEGEQEEWIAQREKIWKKGKHETKAGDMLKIKEMTTDHLINTINHFKSLDTSPLEKELKKRNK